MTKYVKLYLSLINGNHIQPKLLSLRMSAGLKLRKLAMATGIDQALLSKYENGSRVPPETHLGLLSAVYQAASRELRILWLAENSIIY